MFCSDGMEANSAGRQRSEEVKDLSNDGGEVGGATDGCIETEELREILNA